MRVKNFLGAIVLFASPMLEAVPAPADPAALPPVGREAIEPASSGAGARRARPQVEPIFKATFDAWNTAPDVAAEKGVLKEGIDPELQLRMCDDVRGADVKGNSLSLTVPEYVAYPCGGNFRPDRGTVSLWVKPMNYTLADSRFFQPYFSVEASGYQFYVYKYHQTPDAITVYMNNGGKSYVCRGPAKWKRESWHHVAVAWDPNMIALYLDGKEAAKKTFNPPAVLPRKGELRHAKITLGDPKPWSSLVKDRLTQFDDLMIYDRRLTAKDVFDLFASTRPDLAAQAQAPAAEEEQPPVLTYRTFPAENKIKVKIDLGAADLPSDRDIPVELTLTKKGSVEPLVRRTVVFATLDSEVDFPLGTLEDRTDYQIAATIPGVKKPSVAKLRIPDRTEHVVTRDHETPSPWFPVKRLSKTEFAVLDRTYTFGENLYPVRIVSRGEDVLLDAPTFLLNGRRVRWETPRVTAESGDVTAFSATGTCGDFVLRGRGELWFDGFYKAEVELEPKSGAAAIDSFDLVWSVPRAAARYLLTPDWAPWRADGSFSGRFGVDRNDTSAVWLTGPVNGFCWWCASDANWVVDGKDNVSIRRDDVSASVRVRIVAKPTTLQGVARYLTGVQGTPAKRPDRAWRDRWYFGIGGDWTTCNWTSFSGRKAADNMRHVTSLEPESPEAFDRFLASKKKEGLDVLVYSMPTHLSDLDDAWDWYYDAWSSLPGIRWGFKDAATGAQAKIMPCCASTAAGDWHVSRAERLFREHPLVKGIYYDISSCTRCDNVQHGHGGVDAFGKPFGTSKAMDLRDYFLRIAKLCRRNGRWLHVHAHNLYLPFVHAFADVCWPGEEQFHLYVDNPRYHYLEGIPAEKYESALNGAIRGMYVAFINQNARAKSQVPSVYEKDLEAFIGTNAVYATLMPSFIYDFRDLGGTFGVNEQVYGDLRQKLKPYRLSAAEFHPYWQDPVATAAAGIRTALYTWKNGEGIVPFLLVVGNFSREAKRLALDVDWSKVGARPARLRDIVTGRLFDATALADADLPSHLFLMLVPETGGSR